MSVDSLMDMTNFEEQYTLPDDDEPSEELRAKREKFLLTRTLPVENSDDQPELVPRTTLPRRGRNLIKSFSASHSSSNESADVGPEAGPSQRTSRRLQEKRKKKVHFGEVHVFYFGRQQAYSVVPSQEGASLGMEDEHHDAKKYTFDGFTRARYRDNERKWNRIKKYIQEQRKKPVPSEIRRSPRRTVTFAANLTQTKPPSIEADVFDVDNIVRQVVSSMVDAVAAGIENEESSSDEEEVLPTNRPLYLIPLEKHIRHALLSTANVQPDPTDFEDCKDIRDSRSKCGCSCTDGICDPVTCECSISGIKCQVDQDGFPCPCDELNCANKEGRVEFNPSRVRTHYLSTMKLLKDTEKAKFEPTSTLPRHIKFPDSDDESGTSTSYLATPPPPIYKTHKPDFVKSLSLDAVDVKPVNPVPEVVAPLLGGEKTDEAGANSEVPVPPAPLPLPPTTAKIVEVAEVEKKKFPVTPTYKRERNASISVFETPVKRLCEETPEPISVLMEEEVLTKEDFLLPTVPSLPPAPVKPAIRTSPRKRLETRTPTSTSIVVVGNVLQASPQKGPKPTMPTARSVALNFSQTIDDDNDNESLL